MSELIGKIVCGYRIVKELGAGGMGKVYLAESAFLTEYKQQVAVKTMSARAANERQAALLLDLFAREANMQVQLKHPHIVSVIQFAVEGDQHFLILEYVPGYTHQGRRIGNVADMIEYETGPVPHPRALKLFTQALEAMSYAHGFRYRWEGQERVGLVHRDIKPGNLLLLDQETVKVSDFGIVKVQQSAHSLTARLTPGTSAYMSPEAILGPQRFGLEHLDARSDIYALGITLYEMLTGRLPFSPESGVNPDLEFRRQHIEQPPPPPSAFYPPIPPQLDQIVLRALEKQPERRYQTAAEFQQAIRDFSRASAIGSAPVKAAPPSPAQPAAAVESRPARSGTAPATASITAADHHAAVTSPAVLLPTPPDAPVSGGPPPRPARKHYLWLAAALVVAAAAARFVQQRNTAPAINAGVNAGVASPSATPTPAPIVPAGMVLIPGGSFLMGRNLSEAEKTLRVEDPGGKLAEVFSYDYPAHEVKLPPFYLDITEVSNREYASFVRATGQPPPEDWGGTEPPAGAEDLPVANISYREAVEYCAWRTAQRPDGLTYRLPTEEEWEFAARGPGAGQPGQPQRLFPWGDQWRPGLANTKEARLNHPQIVTANRAGASPFGVLNLCGNVAEWTASDFHHYPGSDREPPRDPGYVGTYQVIRGGSFGGRKEWAMTTTRAWAKPIAKGPNTGFRCAADAAR
jgi:serine/threonine protein kinase/formylglycine-generating enzyme required for sulfatase activity